MGTNIHRRRAWVVVASTSVALLTGCSDDVSLSATSDANDFAESPTALNEAVIREDFNNTQFIVQTEGIIHDINLGRLTLPARTLPEPIAEGTAQLRGAVDADGILEAETIIIDLAANLDADDSVELRASRDVQILGRVTAGVGGVTIIAGDRIIIAGEIQSVGPVRLLLTKPDGEIVILGEVATRTGLNPGDPDAPHIELLGRGSARIQGQLITRASPGRTGGDVRIDVYGDVRIDSGVVGTTADPGGQPGRVDVHSEQAINLLNEARLGVSPDWGLDPIGGALSLRAASVTVGQTAAIEGGRGETRGANVELTASGRLAIAPHAVVSSGVGPIGGWLVVRGRRIAIGESARLMAGQAVRAPGEVRAEAVENIELGRDARVLGANAECGPGGSVTLVVSGSLLVSPGATVAGGAVLPSTPSECRRFYPGGSIVVRAREAVGLIPALTVGTGLPEGELTTQLDPDVTVDAPDPGVGLSGSVISRAVDRGADAIGFAPALAELVADRPDGTQVEVALSGSDSAAGPFGPWNSLNTPAETRTALKARRFVRYRVRLFGRAFDSPSLDYVEIVLKQ